MPVPSARVETFDLRAAHEARRCSKAASDLASGGPEKYHIVGGAQGIGRLEGAFRLAGAPIRSQMNEPADSRAWSNALCQLANVAHA